MVFNSAAGGDGLLIMSGAPTNLPGVFVGRSTGLKIAGVPDAASLALGAPGEDVTATATPDGWSGLRVWDYTDPANPVLASTFNTVCSADPLDVSCDPAGTYSSHNVIVETVDGQVKAYVSWYTDGMLILDITDPANPVELARFSKPRSDFWGVYKTPGEPLIYGSDRNGGLWIFQELGSGFGRGGGRRP